MTRFALLSAGILLVIGCTPTEPTSAEALESAMARWEARGPNSYDLIVHRGPCECLPQDAWPLRVQVRNGHMESVRHYESGEELDGHPFHAMSVDEMFSLIQSALADGSQEVAVRYDRLLGYPRAIVIDGGAHAVDGMTALTVELTPP